MGESDNSISIPGWAGKTALGVVQAVMLTALFATITWAWNSEKRVAKLETERVSIEARLSAAEVELDQVSQNHLEIELLKTELRYIKDGIGDIKSLLSTR